MEMVKEDGTMRYLLPVEIWEMIRKEVIALEIVAAETKEVERLCPDCDCGGHHDEFLKARGEGGTTFYSHSGVGYWHEEVYAEEHELRHPFGARSRVSIAFYHSALSGLREHLYR